MGIFSKKKSATPEAPTEAPAARTTDEAPKIEAPVEDADPVAPADDPFAAQRAEGDNPFTAQQAEQSPPTAMDSPVGQRSSREWDASKVPPSQFQKRKGSIYSTPNSRDSHHNSADRDKAYHDKIKEKGWGLFSKNKS